MADLHRPRETRDVMRSAPPDWPARKPYTAAETVSPSGNAGQGRAAQSILTIKFKKEEVNLINTISG